MEGDSKMKEIQIQDQVSLNFFRKVSFHKHVKYNWTNPDKGIDKNFESEKFYINPDYYKGELNQIISPKFIISSDAKFFFMGENHFRAVSNFGITDFEILEDQN